MPILSMMTRVFKRIGLLVIVCVLAGVTQANASEWFPQQIIAASDGTLRLLWVTYSNDEIAHVTVWKLDPNGAKTGSGPIYGPPTAGSGYWYPLNLLVAADGTSHLFWKFNGAGGESKVVVWTLGSNGNRTSSGTVYGPYTPPNGGFWYPEQLALAPDGSLRLLWTAQSGSDVGEVSGLVWKLDADGRKISNGPAYGPYSDSNGHWLPQTLLVAPDGTSRLFWTNFGARGQEAAVWTLDANGSKIGAGPVYGPYTYRNGDAWAANELGMALDGTLRLHWDTFSLSDGAEAAAVWTLDTHGSKVSTGPVYGPYSDDRVKWAPVELRVAPDGTSRLLWKDYGASGGNTAAVWTLDAQGNRTSSGIVYGPYTNSDGIDWNPLELVVMPNGTSHLLWNAGTHHGNITTIWTLNAQGRKTGSGPVYGPYSY